MRESVPRSAETTDACPWTEDEHNADERVDSESWVSRQNEAISRCTLPSEETRMQSASVERGIWIVYTENVRVSLCLRNTH